MVCIVDNHGIGIGDIQSCFNNCCGYQHINFPVDKVRHDPFQLMFFHLSVGKGHNRIRHHSLDLSCYLINICYTIVYIIHLSIPGQFPVNGLPYHFLIILHYIGLNGSTVHRRLL